MTVPLYIWSTFSPVDVDGEMVIEMKTTKRFRKVKLLLLLVTVTV